MIVAERKSIPELIDILRNHTRVLVLGCGTCVTVCLSGGEREVCIIASALRMASRLQGFPLQVDELTIERQCDNVFIEEAAEAIEKVDAVLSIGLFNSIMFPTIFTLTLERSTAPTSATWQRDA